MLTLVIYALAALLALLPTRLAGVVMPVIFLGQRILFPEPEEDLLRLGVLLLGHQEVRVEVIGIDARGIQLQRRLQGAARCAQVVWGGDPTTDWGYDGLASVVRAGLGMGLSGVSTWGSDIGGFFSFFGRVLTPELLARWVQLGAFSGVMRTERDGIGAADGSRPQVDDPQQIGNWRRYAKLRTQLYPYVAGAEQEYQQRGLPIMRHLALIAPGDPAAIERDDEFAFGPDLLVAPVLEPGATERTAYLPRGTWIDLWRSAHYVERDGSGTPTYVEHHRTLGDMLRALVSAGLVVEDLVEPEWPERNQEVWGGWSPLRGRLLPGTSIWCARRP